MQPKKNVVFLTDSDTVEPIPPRLTSTWEWVTPELAEQYLALGARNPRKLNERHVLLLAEQMERGQWMPNGEAIVFDVDGHLIDGQHRLSAIVLVGKPQMMLVARGVAREARETIDIVQRKRTAMDTLRGRGREMHTSAIAAVKVALRYLTGERNANLITNRSINPAEHVATMDMYHDEVTTLCSAIRMKRAGSGIFRSIPHALVLAPTVIDVMYHSASSNKIHCDRSLEAGVRFLSGVATGVELSVGSPMYALRSWGMAHRNPTRSEALEASIIAWNAFARGEELRIVRNYSTGTVREVVYSSEKTK